MKGKRLTVEQEKLEIVRWVAEQTDEDTIAKLTMLKNNSRKLDW